MAWGTLNSGAGIKGTGDPMGPGVWYPGVGTGG